MKCIVDGCDKHRVKREYCNKHYLRWWRYGNPLTVKIRARGDGHITSDGYKTIRKSDGNKLEHRMVVEKIIGMKLPINAVIHHADGNGLNNHPSNLVVCPDNSYHRMLHKRQRAIDACGHAHWEKCAYCHQYGDPQGMYLHKKLKCHHNCGREHNRLYRMMKRNKMHA